MAPGDIDKFYAQLSVLLEQNVEGCPLKLEERILWYDTDSKRDRTLTISM